MVHFKYMQKKGETYVALYDGDKFLYYLGKEKDNSGEKMNYIKRKYEGKCRLVT